MHPKIKKYLNRIALAFFTVLLVLAAAEILLRFRPSGGKSLKDLKDEPFFDRSSRYYPVAISRLHPWTRPDEVPFRVAVIGDSISEGAQVQPYDTYGMRLEAMLNLNPDARPAEVHIYALAGTSTKHQKRFLREALDHHPDLVVLGICLNDAEDFAHKDQLKAWRAERLTRVPTGAWARVLSASSLLTWMYEKKEMIRTHQAQDEYFRKLFDPGYSGFRKFKRSVVYFKEKCDEQGISLLAVIFPMIHADLRETHYPFFGIHDTIRDVLAKYDIHTLDLLPVYINKSSERLMAVPQVDGHPNEIGHRMAAEAIFEYLVDNDLVPDEYTPKFRRVSRIHYWEAVRKRMHAPLSPQKGK